MRLVVGTFLVLLLIGCGGSGDGQPSPGGRATAEEPSPPATFVMCGKRTDGGPADLYRTAEGRTFTKVEGVSSVASLTAVDGTAVTMSVGRSDYNQVQRITVAADGTTASHPLSADRNISGELRLSRDGRWLAYTKTVAAKSGALEDAAVVVPLAGGAARVVAVASTIADLDFDGSDRLHVMENIAGGGSRITAAGAPEVRLPRRAFVFRYDRRGNVAASGRGWAEVRSPGGTILARRRGLVVNSWTRDEANVLVLRLADRRLGLWNWRTNRLRFWPRLKCGTSYFAEQ